jgi:hypothetical protein
MDPVINSQTQSPLVRTLSTVPSQAKSFTHGLKDNVPPMSYTKDEVLPWNNISTTNQTQSHKFRVKQHGTWNKAYLKIEMHNNEPNFVKIDETDYDAAIFNPILDNPNVVDDDYADLNAKVRFPWAHDCQLTRDVRKNAVFGGGGAAISRVQQFMNPSTGVQETYTAGSHRSYEVMHYRAENLLGRASNAWNVVNILDEIRLTSNGKLIETVYGETIPAEVVKMPEQERDFYIKGMLGYRAGGAEGEFLTDKNQLNVAPWDPSSCHRDSYGRLSTGQLNSTDKIGTLHVNVPKQNTIARNQHATFLVPVPFSTLKNLTKNFQTRFVQDLEVEVKMKSIGRGFNKYDTPTVATQFHKVTLVNIYHNWHDNIENSIRNANYKKGVPASVYATNWVRANSAKAALNTASSFDIPINTRNLVTEILMVAKQYRTGKILLPRVDVKSDYTTLGASAFTCDYELMGSGKSIWKASLQELQGPDSCEYDLMTRRSGGGVAYGGLKREARTSSHQSISGDYDAFAAGAGADYLRPSGNQITQGGVDYSFGDNMAVMRFGFQTNDEYYTGGIALQTISNPTIRVHHPSGWTDRDIEIVVYVKHGNMIRIDSDTGSITRTLDV